MTATAHDGADASAPALAMPVTESAPGKHPRFRRRRFLVHRRYQLRITAVTVGTVFVLLLVFVVVVIGALTFLPALVLLGLEMLAGCTVFRKIP